MCNSFSLQLRVVFRYEEEEEGDYDKHDSDDISDRSSSDGSFFIAQHMENDDDLDLEQLVNNHNCSEHIEVFRTRLYFLSCLFLYL